MSTELRLRRGTTAQHSTFIGAIAEPTVDIDKKTIVVHDGITPGGTPLAKESHHHNGTYEPADATILKTADIGVSVQSYDANTAKTNIAQTYTASQKAGIVTDNDLSLDLNSAGNDYAVTPSGAGTLTFSNIASNTGKSGTIIFTNSNNYAIAKGSNIKAPASLFSLISSKGDYWIVYHCDGTNVRLGVSGPNV